MKGIHPNASTVAALIAIALSFAGGCRTQTGAAGNPLFAPNRVAPPSTRALAPGQAQPYYQGDPLPVMQSQAAPPAEPVMPSADSNLAWSSPSNSPTINTAPAPEIAPANAPAPDARAVAQSGEPTVAVPADNDSLRFAMPAPSEPAQFSPISPTSIASSQPQIQSAAPSADQGVVPASFNAPAEPAAITPANNPWQSPQMPASPSIATTQVPYTGTPPFASTPQFAPVAPALPAAQKIVVVPPNNMDVTLRAVASPIPRIRMPGYSPSEPAVSCNDGFRPRSSMR